MHLSMVVSPLYKELFRGEITVFHKLSIIPKMTEGLSKNCLLLWELPWETCALHRGSMALESHASQALNLGLILKQGRTHPGLRDAVSSASIPRQVLKSL